MMQLLFDLDGTLTDPFPGISKCIQHALVSLGFPAPSLESLRSCIGPPLKSSFSNLLGAANVHLADEAVVKYRERFGTVGLFENAVYPGIESVLKELKEAGHTLHVATSKPTVYALRILEHFELKHYFHSIHGSELDGTRTEKTDLLAHLLKSEAISPGNAIMIGDRKFDIIGARENGIKGVGVLWGYGTPEELVQSGAIACAASPNELLDWIKRGPATLPNDKS